MLLKLIVLLNIKLLFCSKLLKQRYAIEIDNILKKNTVAEYFELSNSWLLSVVNISEILVINKINNIDNIEITEMLYLEYILLLYNIIYII